MSPRNVLFFIHSLTGGGAERVTANLANWWADRGWKITLVTIASNEEDFYALDPRIDRISLNLAGGGRVLFASVQNNVRRVWALRNILRRVRPEFAIAMMTTANVLLAFASKNLSHFSIGSERIYPPWQSLGRVREFLRRNMYGRLDAVTTVSRENATWLEANTNVRRVAVIPNAVPWPLPQHDPMLDPNIACRPGRRIVIAVGRLNDQKQFNSLIRAFSFVAHRRSGWDLVILGEGPRRSHLEALIRQERLLGRVHMPGKVGNVAEWYRRADLYALSSVSEGFPNVLAEAMAHGLPAVSFDCMTGPRDIIRHGVDGFLVPPNDTADLASSMDKLMADDAAREAMGWRATEVKERFSMERITGLWESLFSNLDQSIPHASATKEQP
jgi:glycosyltransferase involved in cell wall biosynthesis